MSAPLTRIRRGLLFLAVFFVVAVFFRNFLSEDGTLRRLARDLVQQAFGGSAEKLVMHALQDREVSAEELARIRQLLDELAEGKR